jgi:glycosyltransferase involved in cell wall biosynthesis
MSAKLLRIFGNFRLLEGSTYYLSKYCPDKDDPNLYEQFYSENKNFINQYIDQILAVSERVKTILVKNGYDEGKIQTSYIGTRVAENVIKARFEARKSDTFNVIYMGYMQSYKGYHFFINCLEKIPLNMAKKIHVTICAKYSKVFQKKELEKINQIKKRFFKIDLLNGYNSSNQKDILQNQHLGIVPVLWEDNLPQVLVEQIAYGVPVMCSDLGGGMEIVNNPDFIFKAGNMQNFIDKFQNIFANRSKLNDFWNTVRALTTLKEHISFLKTVYSEK